MKGINTAFACRHVRFNEAGDPYQDELRDVVPRVITDLRKRQIGEYNAYRAKAAICIVDGPDFGELFTRQLALDGDQCGVQGGLPQLAKLQEDTIKCLTALAAAGDLLALDEALTKAIKVMSLVIVSGASSATHTCTWARRIGRWATHRIPIIV